MPLNKITCPNCGATLKNSENEITCQYCGAAFNNETEIKEKTIVINNTINNTVGTEKKKSRKWLLWVGIGVITLLILLFSITA